MPQVLSANRLSDGAVVFLAPDESWAERIGAAQVFEGKAALAMALERGQAAMAHNVVVDAAPVDVEITPRGPLPTHIRERIRAAGPTVRLDHGKQAMAG